MLAAGASARVGVALILIYLYLCNCICIFLAMLVAGASARVASGLVLISHSAHTKPGVRLTQRICWDGSVHLGMEELGEGGGGEQDPVMLVHLLVQVF